MFTITLLILDPKTVPLVGNLDHSARVTLLRKGCSTQTTFYYHFTRYSWFLMAALIGYETGQSVSLKIGPLAVRDQGAKR